MTSDPKDRLELAALETRVDDLIKTVEGLATENEAFAQSAGHPHFGARFFNRKDRTGPQPGRSHDRALESDGDSIMSGEVKPVTVTILTRILVGCKEDEREALFASVQYLNDKNGRTA